MKNQLPYDSDLTQEQLDDALTRLSYLMSPESKSTDLDNAASEPKTLDAKLSQDQLTQFITRLYDKHSDALKKLQKLRLTRDIKPNQPQMSGESRRIIQKKIESGNYVAIQERADQIQYQKQSKFQEAKRMRTQVELEEEKANCKVKTDAHARPIKEYYDEVEYRIRKKNEFVEECQQKKLKQEMSEVTFKPQINQNSERILKDLNTPLQERLQKSLASKQMKSRRLLEEEMRELTFKPQLNSNSLKIVQKNLDESVVVPTHERLYSQTYKGTSIMRHSKHQSMLNNDSQVTNQRNKTPPPLICNEVQYSPHLKFIVDLVLKNS